MAELGDSRLRRFIGWKIDGKLATHGIAAAVKSAAAGLLASVPPILLLALGIFGVIRLSTGFTAAKWAGALVIAVLALYATRRAGYSAGGSLLTATIFLLIGAGLVLLKHYFH